MPGEIRPTSSATPAKCLKTYPVLNFISIQVCLKGRFAPVHRNLVT